MVRGGVGGASQSDCPLYDEHYFDSNHRYKRSFFTDDEGGNSDGVVWPLETAGKRCIARCCNESHGNWILFAWYGATAGFDVKDIIMRGCVRQDQACMYCTRADSATTVHSDGPSLSMHTWSCSDSYLRAWVTVYWTQPGHSILKVVG